MYGREPGIARHLLVDEGEVVVDDVRKHWAAYGAPALWLVAGMVCLFAATHVPARAAWIPFWVAVGLTLWAATRFLAVRLDRFVVTNMRVFRSHGVFARTIATMPLTRILDITVTKPVLGRMFGYGHFTFESAAADQGLRDIRFVPRPDRRDLAIQRVVHRAGLRGRRPEDISVHETAPRDPMRTVRLRVEDI